MFFSYLNEMFDCLTIFPVSNPLSKILSMESFLQVKRYIFLCFPIINEAYIYIFNICVSYNAINRIFHYQYFYYF